MVSSSLPRTSAITTSAAGFDRRQHGEQVVGRAEVAIAGAHEQIALADPRSIGRRPLDDAADQQPVTLVEPDRSPQPCRRVGRRERHAEAQALEAPPVRHRRDGFAEGVIDGAGEVEAVLQTMGVDADDPPGAIEHGRAGRAGGARRGVLDGSGDGASTRPAEAGLGRRDLAPRDPAPVAAGGDGDDDIAGVDGFVGPWQGGSVARVDVEHDEIAVDVGADDSALRGAIVGEAHLGRLVAEVVGVGEHAAGGDHEPTAPAVAPDADDRGSGATSDLPDEPAQFVDHRHGHLRCSHYRIASDSRLAACSPTRLPVWTPPPGASVTAGACGWSGRCSTATSRSASWRRRSMASPPRSSRRDCAPCSGWPW